MSCLEIYIPRCTFQRSRTADSVAESVTQSVPYNISPGPDGPIFNNTVLKNHVDHVIRFNPFLAVFLGNDNKVQRIAPIVESLDISDSSPHTLKEHHVQETYETE